MYDVDTTDTLDIESTRTGDMPGPPLRWPPPGLESLQGLGWRIALLMAVGTGIAIVPMLASVIVTRNSWSVGLFGASWWLPIAMAVGGLLVLLAGMERLTHGLLEGVKAVRSGHDWMTVAYVTSDRRHDAGFLLQGARMYSSLEERDRRMLLNARAVAAMGYAASMLWLATMFPFSVFLAGRGIIRGNVALIVFVVLPAALLLISALVAHVFEMNMTRTVLSMWRRDSGRDRRLTDEIREWREDRATRLIHLTPATDRVSAARATAFALVAVGVLVPLPVATLALASAMGPALTQLTVPRLDSSAARIARAMMLEPYALPATGSMTPLEAGEALHAIASIGSYQRLGPAEREPVRRFDAWPRESKPVTLPGIESFGIQVIPRAGNLTAVELTYLERVAEHPGHAELSNLARAGAADVGGGRWNREGFDGMSVFELPVGRFAGLRDATQYHVAKAVLELSHGNATAAETTLREVISVGLLVTRESPILIDALVGASIAASGAQALQSLYQATGRMAEADALRRSGAGIDAMEEVVRALRVEDANDNALRRAMAMTTSDVLPRGLRWEGLIAMQTGAACLNPHTIVFGHGSRYSAWHEGTRTGLVRYESEQALFDLVMRERMLPRELHGRADIVERILGLTLGRGRAAGTCAALLTGFASG